MCSRRQGHQQMCKQELEDDLTEKHQNYPLHQSKIEQDEKFFKRRTLQKDGLAGNRPMGAVEKWNVAELGKEFWQ